MAHNSTIEYLKLLNERQAYNIPKNIVDSFSGYLKFIYRSELENHFSAPMLWIGMYIALASLVCIVAMVADLLHGFRSKKLWFPCEYFRINSAFLTLISVAMKLPMDLTGSMAGTVDQVAKLGSIAFMCTMMANLLPCLATMDDNDLLSNMAALCLLVITVVVNVCIQIQTGVVSVQTYSKDPRITALVSPSRNVKSLPASIDNYTVLHVIYVTLLLALLLLYICSSLATSVTRRNILESEYQKGHETAVKDIQQSSGRIPTFEILKSHVVNHWLMAGSGNSQFIFTTCFHTTSASGIICVFVTILHILTMSWTIESILAKDYDSDYSWSMIVIVVSQFIGVVIGTIVPLARCFALVTSFHDVGSINDTYIKAVWKDTGFTSIFEVQSYWIHKLYVWKQHAIIRLPFHSYHLRKVIQILKELILSFCIEIQLGVVVVSKLLALIPFLFMMCVLYGLCQLKQLLKGTFSSSREENREQNEHLFRYILQIEDAFNLNLAKRIIEGLSKSGWQLIQKGQNSQPSNLINLIHNKCSYNFRGVQMFIHIDHHHFQSLLSRIESASKVTYRDCWRLSVVTLTTIVLSLPKIEESTIFESFLKGVREGLEYVSLVEESLNVTYDYDTLQKVANSLLLEVDVERKWLGNRLQDPSLKVSTCGQIIEWFNDTAKNILDAEERGEYTPEIIKNSIFGAYSMYHINTYSIFGAYSMYRITNGIMRTYRINTVDEVSQQELFDSLSSIIVDIIAACLSNLPQVITMKCHTSEIEKREARVKDAAQLLGKTSKIIDFLRDRRIPGVNPDDLPFMDKWCAYLMAQIP